jgi:hypothetical protein
MSQYNFESMNTVDVAAQIFYNTDAAQVVPMFEELKTLNTASQTEILHILEDSAVADIRQGATLIKMVMSAAKLFGTEPDFARFVDGENLKALQTAAETYSQIAAAKSPSVDPLLAAYVNEVSNLSAAEFNSPELLVAFVRAAESAKHPSASNQMDFGQDALRKKLEEEKKAPQEKPQPPKADVAKPPKKGPDGGKGRHFRI